MNQQNGSHLIEKINAACVEAMKTVVARARFHNTKIICSIDGEVVAIDPDEFELNTQTKTKPALIPRKPASGG